MAEQQIVKKQSRDVYIKQLKYINPLHLFLLHTFVYLTVLCDHPYLVSLLLAILLSLHLVTFLMFLITHFIT